MSISLAFSADGLLVSPDPADNPDGHDVPHSGAGLKASVAACNVADEPVSAFVRFLVDGNVVVDWTPLQVGPRSCNASEASLGRASPGEHDLVAELASDPGNGPDASTGNHINLD